MLSDGKDLSINVEYARGYARLLYERELHDRLLTEVLEADPVQPRLTLTNTLAQRDARWCCSILPTTISDPEPIPSHVPSDLLTVLFLMLSSSVAIAAATQIKIATIAPENSSWMRDMRAGGEEIKSRTEGRVVLKFYGGGVMGNDKKVLRKMRIGQLHGGAFTPSGLNGRFPNLNIYGMPLVFRSLDEVDYVRSRMDRRYRQ